MRKPTMNSLRAALLATAAALSIAGASRAEEPACGCADVADLRNRLCEARAAIDEYTHQIRMVTNQENRTGTPVMYTVDRYKEHVQPCVQEAINQVTDANANRPTADTNNACEIRFKGSPSACLKQVLDAHEGVHVTACKKWENDREGFFAELRGRFTDFREGTTLVDLLNEERVAYNVELNRVRDELDRLSRSKPGCQGLPVRPPGPRVPSDDPCPPPRPRPDPQDSACKHR